MSRRPRQRGSLKAIAEAQDPPVTFQAISKLIMAELARLVVGPAEQLRALELERLDEMQAGVYGAALQGDLAALDRCLTIMERRCRLLGLDRYRDGKLIEEEVRVEITNNPEAAR
jgi:hypothetical protein